MGGKKEAGPEAGTEREREEFQLSQDYLLKIIPCTPVATHTQTPPPTASAVAFIPLDPISRSRRQVFRSERARGGREPEGRGGETVPGVSQI